MWTEGDIGNGKMLDATIAAIAIKGTDQTRNNLVSWEGRYGPGSASHASLVSARTNPQRRRAFELWLWDAFCIGSQPNTLTEAVMQSRDLDAAATIAREAQTSGFAAIAYRPEATTGRHFAILERASIGAPVSFRSFEE